MGCSVRDLQLSWPRPHARSERVDRIFSSSRDGNNYQELTAYCVSDAGSGALPTFNPQV